MMFTGITYRTAMAHRMACAANELLKLFGPFALVGTVFGAIAPLLCRRLSAMLRRLDSLAARWQAGGELTPRARSTPRTASKTPRAPAPRLPQGHAWIARLAQPAMRVSGMFTLLIESDPEFVALLQAAPHAARLYRTLYRMFGAPLPELKKLQPRPPRIRPSRAKAKVAKPALVPYPPPRRFASDVPDKWRLKVPGLNAPRLKNGNR